MHWWRLCHRTTAILSPTAFSRALKGSWNTFATVDLRIGHVAGLEATSKNGFYANGKTINKRQSRSWQSVKDFLIRKSRFFYFDTHACWLHSCKELVSNFDLNACYAELFRLPRTQVSGADKTRYSARLHQGVKFAGKESDKLLTCLFHTH